MNNIKKIKKNWALNEISDGKWSVHYRIDENAPFEFKLVDCSKITNSVRREMKSNEEFKKLFHEKLNLKNKQLQSHIWIKSKTQILEMTLNDVYQCFIKSLKDKSYEDQLFNAQDISFVGPMGPFTQISLIECLNDQLINNYIFSSVIHNQLPSRKFRLKTKGKILVRYGNDLEQKNTMNIKQITESGILFSSKDEFFIEDLARSELIKCHMDTRNLKKFIDNNLTFNEKVDDFFYSENELRYFFIEESKIQRFLSYKSDESNEFFLFIRYHDMLESDIPNIFLELSEKIEDYINFISQC